MDGFAASYLERGFTPAIQAFGEMGARAEYIYATYPTRTFVNHYTMATGLFAESHGIVGNSILDYNLSNKLEDVAKTNRSGFFGGEPIWVSFKRQTGKRTACLNWIGCNQFLSDFKPDINPAYNSSLSTMGTITQVNEALHENDEAFDMLMSGIHSMGLLDCVNVVLVADHGMDFIFNRIYFDSYISLKGLIPLYGVIGIIYKNDSTRSDSSITTPFECSGGGAFRVYTRNTIPTRYHYASKPRIGDFIFDGRPGTAFYATKADDWLLAGDHGYDYITPAMRTIFMGRGPGIRSGIVLPPFQNVQYYHIFETLLGMKHIVRTNGTLGVVNEIFTKPETLVDDSTYIPVITRISDSLTVGYAFAKLGRKYGWVRFHSVDNLVPFASIAFLSNLLSTCASQQIASRFVGIPKPNMFSTGPSDYCSLWLCGNEMISSPKKVFAGISRAHVPLYTRFVQSFLDPLTNLIMRYTQRFGRLVVISGVANDADHDGVADDSAHSSTPTHVFRVLISCETWRQDDLGCLEAERTRVLPFILPHLESDVNCLKAEDLLLAYTARIADIEAMAGIRFFADKNIVPLEVALKLRTFVVESLWETEPMLNSESASASDPAQTDPTSECSSLSTLSSIIFLLTFFSSLL